MVVSFCYYLVIDVVVVYFTIHVLTLPYVMSEFLFTGCEFKKNMPRGRPRTRANETETPPPPMTPAAIEALINQRVADAVAASEAQRHPETGDSRDRSTGGKTEFTLMLKVTVYNYEELLP
jgi:hypothetical protein